MAKKGFSEGYRTYDTSNGFGNAGKWQQSFKQAMSEEEAVQIIEKETPYSILEINTSATQEEIKRAFRRMIAIWHPDLNPDRLEEAEAKSKKIIAAYTLLKSK